MKPIWTDDDLDAMGWHDCTIRAIALPPKLNGGEVSLDLDYIVRWVRSDDGLSFSFEVAPATLIFTNVWSIDGELESARSLQIDALTRNEPETEKQRGAGIWVWSIVGHEFVLTLEATGFRQILRKRPLVAAEQFLSDEQRGGISFSRTPFD